MANRVKRTPDFTQVQEANKKARWGGPAVSANLLLTNLNVLNRFDGRSRAFFNSDPNIDDDDEAETSPWQFVKPLGAGGFGAVALWARKDKSDFCAVKDDTYKKSGQYGNGKADAEYRGMYKGIVKEAVYQSQLNEFQGNDNRILHLRRFKAYHDNIDPLPNGSVAAENDRIRLYFDYGPFRDLEVLRMRYRAWENHLHELFIWHVFHSLAQAVQLMNEGAWTRWHHSRRDPSNIWKVASRADAFLNHFDIKLENIFLGAPVPQMENTSEGPDWDPCAEYPQVILADFGLADLLVEDNKSLKDTGTPSNPMPNQGRLQIRRGVGYPNPKAFWGPGGALSDQTASWGCGTRFYHPSEQLRLSSDWIQPCNRQASLPATGRRAVRPTIMNAQTQVYDADDAMGVRFTEKSNIWAIGKVLFDLTLLVRREFYLDSFRGLPNDPTAQQTAYNSKKGHMLGDLQTSTTPQYSDKLRKLISDCMAISQDDRPSVQKLLEDTQANLDTWKDNARKMTRAQRRRELRVYYKGTEINEMPIGPATFTHTAADFEFLMNDVYRDLADPPLILPDDSFALQKAADADRRRVALETGEGGPFQMRLGVGGQMEFIPPTISGADTTGGRVNLSFNDNRIQRVRRFIENRVRQELQVRNITQQWFIDAQIARDLKDRSKCKYISAEDIAIISILQGFYRNRITGSSATGDDQAELGPVPLLDPLAELCPPPTEQWLDETVTDREALSLLFLHNPGTPAELQPFAEGVEDLVRNGIQTALANDPSPDISRRYLIRRVFEYLERAQEDHASDTTVGLAQERISALARVADFVQELRRRYKFMGVPERPGDEPENPNHIADILFAIPTDGFDIFVNPGPDDAPIETYAERSQRLAQEAIAAQALILQQQQQQQPAIPPVIPPVIQPPVRGGPRQLASGVMGKYCKHPCFTGINPRTRLPCGHTGCCHLGVLR